MLHLLAMIFFTGVALMAVRLIWMLIGEEWEAVERALGLAEEFPCSGAGRSPARRSPLDSGLRRSTAKSPAIPLRAAA